jgi:hypothetical protein
MTFKENKWIQYYSNKDNMKVQKAGYKKKLPEIQRALI